MLKKYYGVEEAVEYLSELHKQRISKRDVLELGVRGDIRLCFWVDGVITKFKDNFEGAEFVGGGGSFRGYALIPPLHISLNGKMSGIRSIEIVEVVDYDSTSGSDQPDEIEWPEIYSVYKCSEETGAITPVSQTVKTKAILIPAIDLLNLSTITKSTSKQLGGRAETTYLNIIAALIDVISNGIPDSEVMDSKIGPAASFKSEAKLIAAIAEHYKGYSGLSKSNLERKIPEAKRSLMTL